MGRAPAALWYGQHRRGVLPVLAGLLARGLARGAAPGRDRAAIEQARLIAEAVPARPAVAREQLEVGSRQEALDAPVRLLRLARMLAPRRQQEPGHVARPPLGVAARGEQAGLGIGPCPEAEPGEEIPLAEQLGR